MIILNRRNIYISMIDTVYVTVAVFICVCCTTHKNLNAKQANNLKRVECQHVARIY